MKARIHLTNFCLLAKDSQHAKFQFRLENFSQFKDHLISKVFYFAGHVWKLQVSKKNGHFGMFLRWYGTHRDLEESTSLDYCCNVATIFAIVNVFFPRGSILEGYEEEENVFEKISGGIGYGKMAELSELNRSPGYIVSDCVYLQMRLKILGTTFTDRLSCVPEESHGAVLGKEFWFYGTTWRLQFYPHGEEDPNEDESESENGSEKSSSIFLLRTGENSLGRLRHNVKYRISVIGRKDILLDQHFYYKESNAYGTAVFIPVSTVKAMTSLDISVTIEHVVPYTYFAYEQKDLDDNDDVEKFAFEDHFGHPWSFHLSSHTSNTTKGYLTMDPHKNNKTIASIKRKNKFMQVCWLAELLSPVDVEKSVLAQTNTNRQVKDSVFHRRKMMDHILFPKGSLELFSGSSLLTDENGLLSIRLSIYPCNFVTEESKRYLTLSLNDVNEIWDEIRRSVTPPPPKIMEVWVTPSPPPQPELKQNIEDDESREALIQSLVDHLDSSHEYIKKLEKNPRKARYIHGTTSIASLVQSSRPSDTDYKHLALLAKTMEDIFYTIPVEIEKILHSGALGQGTVVANDLSLDYVIYLKNYRKHTMRIKLILNVVIGKIKEHSTPDHTDISLNRMKRKNKVPYVSNFYNSSHCLLYKAGHVNVSVILSEGFSEFKAPGDVYKKAGRIKKHGIHQYITMMSYLQVRFVEQQPLRCKEMICVVKSWSNDVIWKNAQSRPGAYLLTLLVIDAYQTVENSVIGKTPSFDREVLFHFGRNVNNRKLRAEWNENYNPDNYDLKDGEPLVRDPALPYHNVAKTGLQDWKQFRCEVESWLGSITF